MTIETHKHYTETIYYEIEQTAKFCKTLGSQIFEKFELKISSDEFYILDTLLSHPEICQRDLAKLILRDRANTGRLLNSLEEKGFIKRFVDLKNNRLVKKMEVTESGEKIWNECILKIKPIFTACMDKFPQEDIEILRSALSKFRHNLEEIVDLQI
ncbi:MarR family transcriptional regulator [bacterium]|nr:MarR family transcriptional regulator [bacterium]